MENESTHDTHTHRRGLEAAEAKVRSLSEALQAKEAELAAAVQDKAATVRMYESV